MKFDMACFIFMVMCLLKLILLSSIHPRYLILEPIWMTSLPAISGELVIFWSWILEPNVTYLVLSAFSFRLIWSIQDFIVINVVSSFSFVYFSFCVSLANPFICVDFPFCCINVNPIDFSLEQNILLVLQQAFILYWELHQVWEQPSITLVICVAMLTELMLWIQSMPTGKPRTVVKH